MRHFYQRAFYCSGVACAHIEFLPTGFAVEAIERPYGSSRFAALYWAHSFSVLLVTSGDAIPNRPNDRIVDRTMMLCRCGLAVLTILTHFGMAVAVTNHCLC